MNHLSAARGSLIDDEYHSEARHPIQSPGYVRSKDASLVLPGFNVPEISACLEFQHRFDGRLEGMPTTILVHASGEADALA